MTPTIIRRSKTGLTRSIRSEWNSYHVSILANSCHFRWIKLSRWCEFETQCCFISRLNLQFSPADETKSAYLLFRRRELVTKLLILPRRTTCQKVVCHHAFTERGNADVLIRVVFLYDQHRIAVAKEPVLLLNRFLVRLPQQLIAAKGSNKNNQSAFG